ncbi:hypothetical protein RB195_016017 [Necator americanus]|uniref:Uncharacterized protein n=1 Tax=Necator americanus TaxID=51031 RepID=A0ABR1E7B1_NECAM
MLELKLDLDLPMTSQPQAIVDLLQVDQLQEDMLELKLDPALLTMYQPHPTLDLLLVDQLQEVTQELKDPMFQPHPMADQPQVVLLQVVTSLELRLLQPMMSLLQPVQAAEHMRAHKGSTSDIIHESDILPVCLYICVIKRLSSILFT